MAGAVFRLIGLWFGIVFWATCFWFFGVALISVIIGGVRHGMKFKIGWFGTVFPNAGFAILTIQIGESLSSPAIKWVGTIMAPCIAGAYAFVFPFYIKAIIQEKVMAPGVDADATHFKFDDKQVKKDIEV